MDRRGAKQLESRQGLPMAQGLVGGSFECIEIWHTRLNGWAAENGNFAKDVSMDAVLLPSWRLTHWRGPSKTNYCCYCWKIPCFLKYFSRVGPGDFNCRFSYCVMFMYSVLLIFFNIVCPSWIDLAALQLGNVQRLIYTYTYINIYTYIYTYNWK